MSRRGRGRGRGRDTENERERASLPRRKRQQVSQRECKKERESMNGLVGERVCACAQRMRAHERASEKPYRVCTILAATHCNTLEHTATHTRNLIEFALFLLQHSATHCNTLHAHEKLYRVCAVLAATYCNALQHAATQYTHSRHPIKFALFLLHKATQCNKSAPDAAMSTSPCILSSLHTCCWVNVFIYVCE